MSVLKDACRALEEASSSSEDDEDESSDESIIDDNTRRIKSIDDLPSDDSVSLDSDGAYEDPEEDDESPHPSFLRNDSNKVANRLSLAEKLERKDQDGVRTLKERRDRRTVALAKAKHRLKEVKSSLPLPGSEEQNQQSSLQIKDHGTKKSKHAPTEVSSKRKDYFKRGAPQLNSAGIGVEIGAHRYKPRDPRMSSMSGRLQEDHFEHHYGFLQDVRQEEIAVLQRRIKARKVEGKKGQRLRQKLGLTMSNAPSLDDDEQQLQSLKQQLAQYQKNQVDRAAKQTVKRKIRDEVESGQRGAYFVKRAEKKKLELEARYEELSKRGDLMKVLAKKRKKNKSKDASLMK